MFDAESLRKSLDAGLVPGRVLLDRLKLPKESSRLAAAYGDPRWAPFYYHLGKLVGPKSVLEVGFDLGLLSSSFLKSCKSVENFGGCRRRPEPDFSPRLGLANVRKNYKGHAEAGSGSEYFQNTLNMKWGLVLVTEEGSYDDHLFCLDSVWPSVGGFLVCEGVGRANFGKAFRAFCGNLGLEPVYFATRYGTAVLEKEYGV